MPNRSSSDRTVTRSFRISERSLKALEEEAERQNIGVSMILNQQLLAFTDFDRFYRRLGLVKISAGTFRRILQAASEAELARAGEEAGADTPKGIILSREGVLNLTSITDHMKLQSEFGGLFEYSEINSDRKKIITLLHRLGPKASIFFVNYIKALFDAIGSSPRITSTEHSVLIEVPM